MNRKKKINTILKQKQKKKNAKLHKSNKPKYISKAEREKLALLESEKPETIEQAGEDLQENSADNPVETRAC